MAHVVYSGLALFILSSFVFQLDSCLDRYVSVISDVHEYYETSNVFFVISRENRCFGNCTSVPSWRHDFVHKYDFTSIIHLDQLDERTKWHTKRIGRSLLVIFLESLRDVVEFTQKFMNKSYIWLVIFTNESGSSALCEYCKASKRNSFRLRFNTEMLVLCCDSLIVKEWWSIDGDHIEVADFAAWTDDNWEKLIFLAPAAVNARRYGVQGAGIRIALVETSDLVYEVGDEIQGWFGDILAELKRYMNFTIKEIVRSPEYGTWNSQTKNWTGIIGRVAQGNADIGVGDFTITNSRLEVVRYTLPLAVSKSQLYIRDPRDGDGVNWTAYFQAFAANIWIATILLVMLASILLAAIKVSKSTRSLPCLIIESYVHIWGIFCQQGLCEVPAETSLRIVYLTIFILALILYTAYGGSLVSFLLISPLGLPFTSLESFVNDGSYRLIVIKDTAAYEFIANSSVPVLKEMMALMKPVAELPKTLSAGWEQVCREKVAFYTDDVSVMISRVQTKCTVATIDSGYSETLAMIIPNGSRYSRVLDYHIQRFKDTGVIERLKHKYYDYTYASTAPKFEVLNLWDIAPVLTTLTSGVILALLLLLGEVTYYFLRTNLRSRRSRKLFWKFWTGRRRADQILIHHPMVGLRPIDPNTIDWKTFDQSRYRYNSHNSAVPQFSNAISGLRKMLQNK